MSWPRRRALYGDGTIRWRTTGVDDSFRATPPATPGRLAAKDDPPTTISYEDFLKWATEDTWAEWVDGKIIMPSPANVRHQRIAQLSSTAMLLFAQQHQLGEVLNAPFQMKLAGAGREPDMLFLAKEHGDRLKDTYLDGPSDLVVEIVSPDSIGRDRGEKFYEYQAAGIPEYWLIDPLTSRAEFYQLDAAGAYQLVPPGQAGVYGSKMLPGFRLRVPWLWLDPLPAVADVLRESEVCI